MTQTAMEPKQSPEEPLTYQDRRTVQEIQRKVNGIQVQLARLLAMLDNRSHQ